MFAMPCEGIRCRGSKTALGLSDHRPVETIIVAAIVEISFQPMAHFEAVINQVLAMC